MIFKFDWNSSDLENSFPSDDDDEDDEDDDDDDDDGGGFCKICWAVFIVLYDKIKYIECLDEVTNQWCDLIKLLYLGYVEYDHTQGYIEEA